MVAQIYNVTGAIHRHVDMSLPRILDLEERNEEKLSAGKVNSAAVQNARRTPRLRGRGILWFFVKIRTVVADTPVLMVGSFILICKRRLADLINRPAFSARPTVAVAAAIVAEFVAVRSVFAVL